MGLWPRVPGSLIRNAGACPTCTTCSSESVPWASSTALEAARSAPSEPSVASRILVGKSPIAAPSSPVGAPQRHLCQVYQYADQAQGGRDSTTSYQKGNRGLANRM